jgi:hypothetical protein
MKRLALHAICPYFAMFPEKFVRDQVEEYSKPRDWIFDPFCGRGTTVLESLLLGRNAAGVDINPVAFCVSQAKAERPSLENILTHIEKLEMRYNRSSWEKERQQLPMFFKRAFYSTTLCELLFLKANLNWRNDRADRFIAALILGSLHGEMDKSSSYFSNQMPRTICLKPDYSLRYWRERKLFPKKREVFVMLREKARYRLKDFPVCSDGKVALADARNSSKEFNNLINRVSLVVTSPPYLNVTNYEEDQWLRLWFLGGETRPTYGKISRDDRHHAAVRYWQFLKETWQGLAPLLKKGAKIVVRLGAIGMGEDELAEQLKLSIVEIFPQARLITKPQRSEIVRRQAQSFMPSSKGCLFEVDSVFAI